MYKLFIQWIHFDLEGETCDRCNQTYNNLIKAIKFVKDKYPDEDIKVAIKELKLGEDKLEHSNWIKINGIPIDKIIKIEEVHNYCKSCSDLIGKDVDCKAIKYRKKSYDSIPTRAIVEALNKSLYLQTKR